MTEQTTRKGTIADIKEWKKGGGFFLNLEDDPNDYYKFGASKNEVGDPVEITVKEGSGNFSDKFEIVIIGKGDEETAKPAKNKQDKDKSFTELCDDGAKVYMNTQNLIVEQCCLKAAAEIVGHLLKRTDKINAEDVAKTVNFLKRDFVHDIIQNQEAKK